MMGLASIGFMIGTGGSALVSKTLGEGKHEEANRQFTMLIFVTILFSIVISAICFFALRPISILLGATGELVDYCVRYGRILMPVQTLFILQNVFQNFFITAEKPELNLKISLAAGLTNVILDFLFIAVFRWGIEGAALATAMGQIIGGISPLIYFAGRNNSLLRFTKTRFDGRALFKTCTNGSSELMTNISTSLVNILYNYQLMKLAGENGVAAYGVIMYIFFIFSAVFMGYSIGSAPIVSYNYGSGNHSELKNLFRKSLLLIGTGGILLTAAAELLAYPLTNIFVGYDQELLEMTCHGFRLYAIFYLVCGFNIWGSSFFTALNNGAVSALISFLRTLVFEIGAVLILPIILGIDGIWLAVVVAEVLALMVTVICLIKNKNRYHYV